MAESELLGRVSELLTATGVDWMVTGSVASIGHGVMRHTHDIDIVVEIAPGLIKGFVAAFDNGEFDIDERMVKRSLEHGGMFDIVHRDSGFKVDFWPLHDTPFDTLAFDNRVRRTVLGVELPVIRADHLILQKLRWGKDLGGSEKQFGDSVGIYELRAREIDHQLLDHWAMRIGVTEELKRLRDEAEPL